MGGYNPNPAPDSDAPASTAAEAEARAGKDVGFRGSYGGESGTAAKNFEIVQQNERIRQQNYDQDRQQQQLQQGQQGATPEQNPYNPLVQPGRYSRWQTEHPGSTAMPKKQAELEYESRDFSYGRSRFVSTLDFGDSKTQKSVAGLSGEARFSAIGVTLERQRQEALKTPGTRDDRYFQNQLDLWNAQDIERSSGYHVYGKKSGVQIPSNPYENVGDIALAIEKAGNQKDNLGKNYAFNPNVGSVLQVLPQKRNADGSLSPVGLQEYGWMGAVARDRNKPDVGAVSFMPAIEFLNSQRGRQGVYGDLYGGVKDVFTPLPKGSQNGGVLGELIRSNQKTAYAEPKRPFVSINAPVQRLTEDQPFADSTVQKTYRPSDQTLFVMNAPGMQTSGRGQGIGKLLIGVSDFMFPGSFIETRTGKKQEISRGEYDKLFQSGQPMATWKYIDPDTNKPTDKMRFDVGEPYVASDGKTYQDYRESDLSKVTIVPQKVEIFRGQSGFERGESNFADKITKRIMPDIRLPRIGTPADHNIEFVENAYAGVREKPLTASINAGIGLGVTALTAGVINPATSGFAASTAAAGSRLAIPAAVLNFGVTKALPVALTGMYAYEFSSTATKGFTDLSPEASGRAGKRFGYETGPMIVGGLSYLPMSALTPKAISATKDFYNRQMYSSPSGPDFTIPQPVRTRGQSLELGGGESPFSPKYLSRTPKRTLELVNDDAAMAWSGVKRKGGSSPPPDREWGIQKDGTYKPWKPKKWITEYPKPKPVETKVATTPNMRTVVEEKPLQLVATARRYPGTSIIINPGLPTSLKTEYGKVITGFQKKTNTGWTRSLLTTPQPPNRSGVGTVILPPNYLNTGRSNDFNPPGLVTGITALIPPQGYLNTKTGGGGSGTRIVAQPIPPLQFGRTTTPQLPPTRITSGYTPIIPVIPPFFLPPGGSGSAYAVRKRKRPFLE
ncbi:MAG: hypothetical protein M0Q91_16115, partial [Methanoregula sp.]|nr:hypothetical protein [Methanoregula sp.]